MVLRPPAGQPPLGFLVLCELGFAILRARLTHILFLRVESCVLSDASVEDNHAIHLHFTLEPVLCDALHHDVCPLLLLIH